MKGKLIAKNNPLTFFTLWEKLPKKQYVGVYF